MGFGDGSGMAQFLPVVSIATNQVKSSSLDRRAASGSWQFCLTQAVLSTKLYTVSRFSAGLLRVFEGYLLSICDFK